MDVLFGDVNPSGRLPYTIARKLEDYNGQVCSNLECNYDEGLFIDYRHFDKAKIQPRYEFGFGLCKDSFFNLFSHAKSKIPSILQHTQPSLMNHLLSARLQTVMGLSILMQPETQ
jgi:hypothetical protein